MRKYYTLVLTKYKADYFISAQVSLSAVNARTTLHTTTLERYQVSTISVLGFDVKKHRSGYNFFTQVATNTTAGTTVLPFSKYIYPERSVNFASVVSNTTCSTIKNEDAKTNGFTSASHIIKNPGVTDAACYTVMVIGTCGNTTSTPAVLTFRNPVAITVQPANQDIYPQQHTDFTITVADSPAFITNTTSSVGGADVDTVISGNTKTFTIAIVSNNPLPVMRISTAKPSAYHTPKLTAYRRSSRPFANAVTGMMCFVATTSANGGKTVSPGR